MATGEKRVEVTTTRDGGHTRVRMVFPVRTDAGRRPSARARPVSATFVQLVTVERGGAAVFVAYLGPNMARMPELAFDLEGLLAGERLTIRWVESGDSAKHEQEFTVI